MAAPPPPPGAEGGYALAAYPPPGAYPAAPPLDAYGGAYVALPPAGYGAPPGYGAQPGYGHPPPGYYAQPPPGAYGVPPPGYYPPPGSYGPPPAYGAYPGGPPPGYPPAYHPPGYYPPPGYPPYYGRGYSRSRSRSRSRSPRRARPGEAKHTCRFFIGIDNEEEFRVARRIIGTNGSKMKGIVSKSGGEAKLRLRGKGSAFVERDTNEESPEPLQLCISCPTREGYDVAVKETEELLKRVYQEFDSWNIERNRHARAPAIRMTEKHLDGGGGGGGAQGRRGGGGQRRRGGGQSKPPQAAAAEDRGEPGPNAPGVQEIEKAIQDRNDARKKNDYQRADRIRDDLKAKGVVLSDEKGAHGGGLVVTSWRYWHD